MSSGHGAYAVEWTATARRTLSRLPEKVATAAMEFIYGALAENPRRLGHELRFDLDGLHSARRGDHRIIYRIDDEGGRVIIQVIEHRSDVYRPRG